MVKHYTIQEVDPQSHIKSAAAYLHSDVEEIHKKELEKVNKKMMEQEEIFKKAQASNINDLEECEDKEGKCQQELIAKEAEVNNLKSKIQECESTVLNKQKQIEELKAAEMLAKECKGQLQIKDGAIRGKEAEINSLKNKIQECESSVLNKQKQIEELKAAEMLAKECKEQLQIKDGAIIDKEAEINNLKSKVQECKKDASELDKVKDELDKCKNDHNKCKDDLSKCNKGTGKPDEGEGKHDEDKGKPDEGEGKPDKAPNTPSTDDKGCQDDGEPYTVVGKEITLKNAQPGGECGSYAGYYKSYSHVGHYGFNTACMLKKWFPEMYKDPIKAKIESIDNSAMPGNFKIAFTDDINYTWGKPSDMWCYPCKNYDSDKACGWEHNDQKAQSRCVTANSHWDSVYSHNFFSEVNCPNLVSNEVHAREKSKEIYAKLVEPIVLYERNTGKIISRDGEVTDQLYSTCKQYINSNFKSDGKVAENSCNKPYYEAQCKACTKALEEALWTAKDPIKLNNHLL